jgi:hypothetical protein
MNGDETREIKVTLGKTEADVPYSDEKHRALIEKIAKELNVEFNIIKSKSKIANENILLFFLLLKTQGNILQKTGGFNITNDIGEFLQKSLYAIASFVQDDKEDKERMNKILVAVNVYKRIDLLTVSSFDNEDGDEKKQLEGFVSNIKKQIKLMEDKILLL